MTVAVAAGLSLLGADQALAAGTLPTGGSVVAGTGSISQSGNAMTINQSSSKLAIDWQSFSVGQGYQVNFVQPGANAVALNRVLGSDVSVIQGAIKANGQVFLLNPNGVLFSPTAQVNVGSLLASTLNMSTADFMAGNYKLSGTSSNAVVNQGNITAVGDGGKGGSIALIAAKVSNEGNLAATGGNVLMAAASSVTLDLGGPVKLQVNQGTLDALVENGGAIQADGGFIYLTAKAVNELTSATVNNTGTVRAQTLATGEKGEIRLIGDMSHGTLNVGGTLDASAPRGGDGGFIETSAMTVNMADGLAVTTLAPYGKTGTLLVDPNNYTVAASGGNATGASFTSLINSNNVTISTASYGTAGGSGDIFINDNITKTAAAGTTSLTFLAERNIEVNASITSIGAPLNIELSAANNASGTLGGVQIVSGKTLNSNGGNILIGGAGGSVAGAQTLSHGIGYALNYSASQEAVSIGSSANILSRGGDITINGYSNQPVAGNSDTTGVHVGASAVIDSGYYAPSATTASYGGYINISGKYVGGVGGNSNKVFGVKIDNPSGGGGQTTISASTTTGAIRIEGSSTYDTPGTYALNMATNGLAGNIYFNAYSVADLIFILNGGLTGATFTYSPPTSGCRTGYPNCGMLFVSGANNSYLYATYNAVNMSTLPVYVSATLTGTKAYDGTLAASNLGFSNISILDPNLSGYTSANVTSASYVTPGANVGAYSNLSASSLSRNYTANGNTYVVGYNFTVSPSYTITPATATLSAVKTYNGDASFSSAQITASGVNGETLALTGSGPATANSSQVTDNTSNFLTALGGLTLANGASGTVGLSSNYVLPSLSARSTQNTATINPFGVTVIGVGGSKNYDGTTTFSASQLNLGAGVAGGDSIALAGSADVASKNVGTYTQWTSSSLSLTGTQASNYTLTGGAVSALINPAPLGVAVNSVYNGTNAFVSTGGATNASAGTIGTGGTLAVTGLVGSERLTGVTVSDANVDVVTANKYVTGASGSNGFLASNYALYNAGTPTYNVSTVGSAITTSNNTVSITPAPLGIAAAPTYNGSTGFTASSGVPDNGTSSLTTGGNVSVAGLVNGQTLGGFTLDNANVVGATKVTGVTLNGGIDARNYVLNGATFGSASSVVAGSATDGSAATNVVALAAAPLGVAIGGTYNGTTSIAPTSLSTYGLLGSDTITALTSATINSPNVYANGSNFVKSIVVGSGSTDIRNYAINQTYNATLDINGKASSTTTSVATLVRAPLGVAVSGTYNGTTTLSTADGATITGYGLVGQDSGISLNTATLDSKNVASASKVVSLSGTGTFDLRNYVLDGSLNTTPATAGSALDGSGATNTAALARAALGVAVNGTYNGTTSFTSSNATITTNGLVGGDTLTGVSVHDANVFSNGSNYITALTGGTASLANYILSGNTNTTTSGATISTAHNNATLVRAPLGVAVAGTYNGTSTVSTADGATITGYGLVGQDSGISLNTATLDSKNVASASKVVSLSGTGTFDLRNYVLDGSVNTTPATAGSALDGSGATNTATLARRAITLAADDKQKFIGDTDPGLTYQIASGSLAAGDSLAGSLARASGESLGQYAIHAGLNNSNYAITAVDGKLDILARNEPPPPPNPIIVPAFIDNGSSALSAAARPASFGGLSYVPVGGGQSAGSVAQSGASGDQAQAGRSSLNFVGNTSTEVAGNGAGVQPNNPAAGGSEQTTGIRSALSDVTNNSADTNLAAGNGTSSNAGGDATSNRTGSGTSSQAGNSGEERRLAAEGNREQPTVSRSTLNFVGDDSAEGKLATDRTDNPPAEAGKRKAAQELNVNNVTVPSSSGPLDVFVVDSGINIARTVTLDLLNNR